MSLNIYLQQVIETTTQLKEISDIMEIGKTCLNLEKMLGEATNKDDKAQISMALKTIEDHYQFCLMKSMEVPWISYAPLDWYDMTIRARMDMADTFLSINAPTLKTKIMFLQNTQEWITVLQKYRDERMPGHPVSVANELDGYREIIRSIVQDMREEHKKPGSSCKFWEMPKMPDGASPEQIQAVKAELAAELELSANFFCK